MTELLIKLFIGKGGDYGEPAVRKKYGTLSGGTGIVLNLLLFAAKLAAGIISGSVAVTADALNNLSDAGTSAVTVLGFRLSAWPASRRHPFGHGRAEYLTGLIVSFIIMFMGVELLRESVLRIFTPADSAFSAVLAAVLLGSSAVKLWMFFFNRKLAKRLKSSALRAAALDSVFDAAASAAVAAGLWAGTFAGYSPDGILGAAVSVLIFLGGFGAARTAVGQLLGARPDPELVENITRTVLDHKGVVGMHDLVVHSYGPGRTMISLHAEVPRDSDLLEVHELIDHIELELKEKYLCEATIHVDPIAVGDEFTEQMRARVARFAAEIHRGIIIHDFRASVTSTHTNFIFDAEVPYDAGVTDTEVSEALRRAVRAMNKSYFAVVNIDKPLI